MPGTDAFVADPRAGSAILSESAADHLKPSLLIFSDASMPALSSAAVGADGSAGEAVRIVNLILSSASMRTAMVFSFGLVPRAGG